MNKLIYFALFISLFACKGNNEKTSGKTDNASVNEEELSTKESNFLNYKPDIRIFTVLAFANAAGYEPFVPDSIPIERKEIRLYLDSILTTDFKEKIKRVHKQEKSHRCILQQIYLALNLSYPPNFKLLPDSLKANPEAEPLKNKEQYIQLLNEFYVNADIPKLWHKYSKRLEKNNLKFANDANDAFKNITSFCRVDSNFYSNQFRQFNFYEELLANMGWGSIFNSNDTIFLFMNYYAWAKGASAFYHESLHLLVNPITDEYSKLLKTKEKIAKIGLDKRLKLGTYISLNDLFSESMVTTIDYTLREKFNNYSKEEIQLCLEKEYQKGLFLVPYFYEKLKEYDNSGLSLKEFYPQIISGIDYDLEFKKWENRNEK